MLISRAGPIAAGLLALPYYWLELSYVVSLIWRSPRSADVIAILAALTLAAFTVVMWQRSARAGAITQLALLLPGPVALLLTRPWSRSYLAGSRDVDPGVVVGLLVVAVAPGALIATAVIVLLKRRRRIKG